ncbi:transposase, partial [Leptospira santarosai]|nr:transposase [Leptospira santarosai]MDI7194378.1 transposase [Leptospira santarosai]MDO6398837.1 transposase [Leptospira santarosai]MDO6404220.1 transposase [Leptospira santarosai]
MSFRFSKTFEFSDLILFQEIKVCWGMVRVISYLSHPWNPNRNGNKLFPIAPATQSKKTKMKIPSD